MFNNTLMFTIFYMNFHEKLRGISQKNNSIICVGLDIDKEKMPAHILKRGSFPLLEFNKKITDQIGQLFSGSKVTETT